MIGYKVMRTEDGKIISGRDSRISFEPEVGKVLKMGGNGLYLSPDKEYTLDYYSGLAETEVLLTLEFDPEEIITGNLEDKEPEISVPNATIVDIEELVEESSILEKILVSLKESTYIININALYESVVVSDFNLDKNELKDLNNATLTEVFKCIDMSIHRNNPAFVANVIEPITEYMKEFLETPTHLDELAQFICRTVMVYDERLYEEIDYIFDMYDRIYTCMTHNNDLESLYRAVKSNLPEIQEWEHTFENGKLRYINREDVDHSIVLEVDNIIDLVIFEKDTVCELYKEFPEGRTRVYDEIINHCKYIPSLLDRIPSEFKK